jgi:hypothetical protein
MRHDQTYGGIVHQGLQLHLQITLQLAMRLISTAQGLQCSAQGLGLSPVVIGQAMPPVAPRLPKSTSSISPRREACSAERNKAVSG